MPKFTYPIVFILHKESGHYNGYIPDLGIWCHGEKLEDVYADAEDTLFSFFHLATSHGIEYDSPSRLEDVTKKWSGYKVSLITANIPDGGGKK